MQFSFAFIVVKTQSGLEPGNLGDNPCLSK